MKTKILSILALLLMTVTQGAWAQETLTVFDGTAVNRYIPMNSYIFDNYTKCECIIPASELTAMEGGRITAITFYPYNVGETNTTFGSANQKVFLKEVSGTTLGSSFSGMEGATVVFDGLLPMPTTGGYTITISPGYTYNGGNLLIGVYNDAKGKWNQVTWYGNNNQSSGVSAYGYSTLSPAEVLFSPQTFLPKTTFTYTPGPGTPVDLGLPSGKKWADRNVGAGSETGYGTYYAWSSSDIATAQWGNDWRMPTMAEIEELKSYTDHEWATIGGVNGMKFMKKTDHSVYIFLPATGLNSSTEVGTIGYHWTSTEESSPHAYFLYTSSSALVTSYYRTKTSLLPIRPVQMFAGEGTEASPYLIASTTDWNNLSAAVNGGETYSGKYFKMTANVGTVTTTLGTSTTYLFDGTFDGNGHTLNVNISNTNAQTRTAPFAWAGGSAVIKNLHVTGSLTNTERTSGIVGSCYATTQISSCRVSATISGGNHTSGISISGGQITNCLFDGKINGTVNTAGFATWVAAGTKITNCLFKPQDGSSIPSDQGCFYTSGTGITPTFDNCYYTSTAGGTAQGTNGSGMSAEQLVENLGPSNWKVVGGNAIPKVHPGLSGEGTQASPYLIASTTDWNNLVSAVNAGETYSGNYFKMTANVGTVSTWMTGTFSGTFDGDGKTLTVGYSSSAMYCAPFGYVNGATIKNLNVDGTISTTARIAGGIAAQATGGTVTVNNCLVSATITSTYNNSGNVDGANGGFVAYVLSSATLNITGCAFTGKLLTTAEAGTACSGGYVGWKQTGGTVTISNSLYAPAAKGESEVWMVTSNSATFARNGNSYNNCYYTQDFNDGTNNMGQGLQARTIAAGTGVSTLTVNKGVATITYTVSGITVYSNGIDFNDGSTTTFYGGSGQTVSLALTHETPSGYQFKQYATSQGTLSGETTNAPTLTMPAANSTANDVVTISAEYDPTYNATFASGNDNNGWTISPTQQIAGGTVTVSYEGENKVKSVTVAPKGALTGKFSVSSTSQVQFSKGNLQYVGTWQFAANQYDIFGASQSDDHRDLFGWGTKTNPNETSTTNGDYSWAEWGENTITNGCTGWRTLTKDEWGYLFTDRANASTLRTFATINNVTGLIVMPDGWTASGVTLTITTANYTTNVLSTSQWATLEKQGCVFLPAAGGRAGTDVVNVGSIGDYWSSDASGETNAYDLNFSNNYLLPQNTAGQRHYGWSVRLVRDVAVKANPSTLAGLKAAINDASDLTDLNTKVLGKYVTATGNIQSTSEGAVGIIAYISKTAVDNSFADSRIFVLATENASNSAAQAPSNAAETTYNSTSDLNGYAVTNAWQVLDGYNASKEGWNYSASRPDGASHWFVPSYGQWMLGGWNDGNNRPCSLMRSTMEGSGQLYAVSTAINTEGNNTGYCVDGNWWGMGSIQRIQTIRVRAAFVY